MYDECEKPSVIPYKSEFLESKNIASFLLQHDRLLFDFGGYLVNFNMKSKKSFRDELFPDFFTKKYPDIGICFDS
ncbi:hypothetical protein NIES22_56540 [Calothrix brevissima NIES-22]|nr:hypothetical protein NIES22_56540 [Calothrix brevissima NIES-22]